MILFLTAIDKQGQNREFSCQTRQLEQAFEVLSQIVARGDVLLTAYILENDKLTLLPLDAFDGATFLIPIQKLEQEWQSVLNFQPDLAPASLINRDVWIQWTQQRIDQYEKHIVFIERMVSRFKSFQQQVDESILPGQSPSLVSNHFGTLLIKYEQQLVKAHRVHQVALARLSQLKGSTY